MDKRLQKVSWGAGKPRVRTTQANWDKVLIWDAGAEVTRTGRVFCASLADVFDDEVPTKWLADLWDLIYRCRYLEWQILTKRPDFAVDYLGGYSGTGFSNFEEGGCFDHVRIGTSAEDQSRWDERVPLIRLFPRNFVSAEPLLGPIEMGDELPDWLIVGGESGRGARPMDVAWVEGLHAECLAKRVPFFFKQWGGVDKSKTGRLLAGRTWDELPNHYLKEAFA